MGGDDFSFLSLAIAARVRRSFRSFVEIVVVADAKLTQDAVCRRIEPSRRREVLSWSHHREVAALEPEDADALLDKAEAEGWTRQELRRQAKRVKIGNTGAPTLPSSKYRVVYADPPWSYGDKLIEGYGSPFRARLHRHHRVHTHRAQSRLYIRGQAVPLQQGHGLADPGKLFRSVAPKILVGVDLHYAVALVLGLNSYSCKEAAFISIEKPGACGGM